MSWHVANSLVELEKEITELFPKTPWPRGYGDGAIGDASHAARKSDHNPDYAHGGVVRAIDIAIGGRDKKLILNTLIGDPRVWYVIHNRIIYSRSHGWRALRYTGPSPHEHHIHVSIQGANGISSSKAYRIEHDTSRWFDKSNSKPVKPKTKPTIYYSVIYDQMMKAAGARKGKPEKRVGVAVMQSALNRTVGSHLKVDGVAGVATLDAYAKYEKKTGVEGRPRIPNDVQAIRDLVRSAAVVK